MIIGDYINFKRDIFYFFLEHAYGNNCWLANCQRCRKLRLNFAQNFWKPRPEGPYLEIALASAVLFRSMKVLKDKRGAEPEVSLNFQHLVWTDHHGDFVSVSTQGPFEIQKYEYLLSLISKILHFWLTTGGDEQCRPFYWSMEMWVWAPPVQTPENAWHRNMWVFCCTET